MPKRPQVMLCTDRFQDQALRFQAQGVLASSSGFSTSYHSSTLLQLYASSSSTLSSDDYVYSGGR